MSFGRLRRRDGAINLGEVAPSGSDKASMKVTSPESTFGLLLTAEPYLSVQYPSDVVAVESSVRPDTVGRVEEVQVKYELMPRGQYTLNVQAAQLASAQMKATPGVSMEEYEAIVKLYQARNAVQIARADGAGNTLDRAQTYLDEAESSYKRKNFKTTIDSARQAVQIGSGCRHDRSSKEERGSTTLSSPNPRPSFPDRPNRTRYSDWNFSCC